MMNETIDTASAVSKFNWIEYCTFGSLLGLSLLIGIYYGCIKRNQNTADEYLLGGKSMKVLPIAISLITSHLSGITLLGIPAEIYEYGTQYVVLCISTIFIVYVTNEFFMPVLYPLQLNSLYEYLELRFSRGVRLTASVIFALSIILHVPVIIYIPSLAFHQVTGISVHHFAPIICFLCIFYTSIGGLKAVVWTDAIQGIFTVGSVIVIIVLGVINKGGLENIFQISKQGERLEFFNMDPNPLARNTFWTNSIGGFCLILVGIAVHPGSVQRFIALPTIRAAKCSVRIYAVGMILMKVLTMLFGLIVYAKYYSCDPITSGKLKRSGELIPYYVQDVASKFPGLTGIFISGLVSAALSTMSAGLNTLAGTLYEDFFSNCMPKNAKNSTKASFIMKITVVCTGCICVLMVYVVQHMGTILQMSISLCGVTQGSILAVFILGIFCPQVNKRGAILGMIVSAVTMGWIVLNAQIALYQGNLKFATKPMYTYNCTEEINPTNRLANLTEIASGVYADKDLFGLYALSYMYYTVLGTLIGIIVGIVVSWLSSTKSNDAWELDPALITPKMRRLIPKKKKLQYEYPSKRDYQHVSQEISNIGTEKND